MAEWFRQGPAKPCTRVRFPASPPAVRAGSVLTTSVSTRRQANSRAPRPRLRQTLPVLATPQFAAHGRGVGIDARPEAVERLVVSVVSVISVVSAISAVSAVSVVAVPRVVADVVPGCEAVTVPQVEHQVVQAAHPPEGRQEVVESGRVAPSDSAPVALQPGRPPVLAVLDEQRSGIVQRRQQSGQAHLELVGIHPRRLP